MKEDDAEMFTEEFQASKEEEGEVLVQNYLNPPTPEEGS